MTGSYNYDGIMLRVFDSMSQRNIYTYNIMLGGLSRDKAFALFRQMRAGSSPMLSKDGGSFSDVLNQVPSESLLDRYSYNVMIKRCVPRSAFEADLVLHALRLFEMCPHPDAHTFSLVFTICGRNWQEVQMFEDERHGTTRTVHAPFAEEIFVGSKIMEQQGKDLDENEAPADATTSATLAHEAFNKSGRRRLEQDAMLLENRMVLNPALAAFSQDWERALLIYQEMYNHNVTRCQSSWSLRYSKFSPTPQETISFFYRDALINENDAESPVTECLYSMFCKYAGRSDHSLSGVTSFDSQDRRTWEADYERLREKEAYVSPDTVTIDLDKIDGTVPLRIDIPGRTGQRELSKRNQTFFDRILSVKERPRTDIFSHSTILAALGKSKRPWEALRVLERMDWRSVDGKIRAAVLSAFPRPQILLFLKILLHMKGEVLTSDNVGASMDKFPALVQFARILNDHESLRREYHNGKSRSKSSECGRDPVELNGEKNNDVSAPFAVSQHCDLAHVSSTSREIDAAQEMISVGLRACVDQNNLGLALELLSLLQQRNRTPRSLDPILRIYVENADFESAARFYESYLHILKLPSKADKVNSLFRLQATFNSYCDKGVLSAEIFDNNDMRFAAGDGNCGASSSDYSEGQRSETSKMHVSAAAFQTLKLASSLEKSEMEDDISSGENQSCDAVYELPFKDVFRQCLKIDMQRAETPECTEKVLGRMLVQSLESRIVMLNAHRVTAARTVAAITAELGKKEHCFVVTGVGDHSQLRHNCVRSNSHGREGMIHHAASPIDKNDHPWFGTLLAVETRNRTMIRGAIEALCLKKRWFVGYFAHCPAILYIRRLPSISVQQQ